MTATEKSGKKKTLLRKVIELLVVVVVVGYVIPAVKHELFPGQMTRLEKMLGRSTFDNCSLEVERVDEREILLTVNNGANPSYTTEIYQSVVQEMEAVGDSRIFFSHSINRDDDDVFYLIRTLIEADADLKQVRRLEASFCGRLKDQTGMVHYKDYEPIYECDVPEQKAVCFGNKEN